MDAVTRVWTFPESVERVWRALTDPTELAEWLLPNDFVARVGHRFALRGGQVRGLPAWIYCQVLELEAPHRLVLGWSHEEGTTDTILEFSVHRVGNRTELRIHHRGFADITPRAAAQATVWNWGDDVRSALAATLRAQVGGLRR
jgi:uncharacterized protein YndB with AHSA1/START domain